MRSISVTVATDPSAEFDAYLREKQSCQISFRSSLKLKQQPQDFFEKCCTNNNKMSSDMGSGPDLKMFLSFAVGFTESD